LTRTILLLQCTDKFKKLAQNRNIATWRWRNILRHQNLKVGFAQRQSDRQRLVAACIGHVWEGIHPGTKLNVFSLSHKRSWVKQTLWRQIHTPNCFKQCLCDDVYGSASSTSLDVRRTRLSTVGDRAFPVAAARLWNSLPSNVTAVPSLSIFCCRLKSQSLLTFLSRFL